MLVHWAPLWLLGAVLGSFVPGDFGGSSRHSLCYSYLKVSEPSEGLPQFLSVIHLDDHPIARYDILNGKTVPLVPWMEEEEMKPEKMFRADLERLSKLNHQTGGLHTWQVDLGCELREDGSKRGFLHYGYNGMDFISFDKETLRWVAAQPQAKKVKEKWEDDPRWSQGHKIFLEETCIEWLQRYLSYQKEALKKTEPPVGKVTGKVVDDRLEVLICQAFGFYPKEIQAIWMRDGEVCKYETLPRNVAPNSDGTYYVWLSIEIDPKERDRFQCRLEHEGLQEPLILALKEEPATGWLIPVGIVASLILGTGILFLIYQWRRSRKNFHCKRTTYPDCQSPEMLPSPTIHGTEDETQSQAMLQPTVSSEHSATYGGWKPERALENVVSTLPSGEWKQHIMAGKSSGSPLRSLGSQPELFPPCIQQLFLPVPLFPDHGRLPLPGRDFSCASSSSLTDGKKRRQLIYFRDSSSCLSWRSIYSECLPRNLDSTAINYFATTKQSSCSYRTDGISPYTLESEVVNSTTMTFVTQS